MAFRFRKSFKIAPGVRVNIGKNGLSSIGIGPRGASVGFSSRGKHANIGIPGTGLSFRHKLGGGISKREEQRLIREQEKLENLQRTQEALSKVTLGLNDNGSIDIINAFGEPLSRSELKLMWEQQSNTIMNWLENEMNEINGDIELLENIYLDTTKPTTPSEYMAKEYYEDKPHKPHIPEEPTKKETPSLGFFASFFKSKKLAHQQELQQIKEEFKNNLKQWRTKKEKALKKYEIELKEWKQKKEEYEKKEKYYEVNFASVVEHDIDFMEKLLEEVFDSLSWPRETIISYEIDNEGSVVWLDIDLPEIEDLPQKIASIAASGKKLNIKNKPKKQLQLEYAKHIHGIAFRLLGTVFATLPKVEMIVISGYSQRLDKATGKVNDDYLYSYKVNKNEFSQIDFENLELVDPIEALDRFEHTKKMTATGIFKSIKPF